MTIDNVTPGETIFSVWGNAVADFLNGLVETDSYEPTLGNITLGTGGSATNTAEYLYLGGPEEGDRGFMMINGTIILGTSSPAMGTNPTISLPPGFGHQLHTGSGNFRMLGIASLVVAGANRMGYAQWGAGATIVFGYFNPGTGQVSPAAITASTPGSWTAGDGIRYNLGLSVVRTPVV